METEKLMDSYFQVEDIELLGDTLNKENYVYLINEFDKIQDKTQITLNLHYKEETRLKITLIIIGCITLIIPIYTFYNFQTVLFFPLVLKAVPSFASIGFFFRYIYNIYLIKLNSLKAYEKESMIQQKTCFAFKIKNKFSADPKIAEELIEILFKNSTLE